MPINTAVGIELSDDECSQLESWARPRTSAQTLAQRSRIVLLSAEGLKSVEIAQACRGAPVGGDPLAQPVR